MTLTYDQWVTDVLDRQVGDGQCVALAADYVARVIGSSYVDTFHGPHPGYAIGSWDSGQAPAGMTRGNGAASIQKGDVVFWNGFSPLTPFTMLSHVAIANGGTLGPTLPVISQNSPTPVATQQTLPTIGITGYWRPATDPAAGGTGGSSSGAWKPGDPIGPPADPQIEKLVPGLKPFLDSMGTINGLFSHLTDPKLWQRIGLFVLGAALVGLALFQLFANSDTAQALQKGLSPDA